MRFDFKDDCTPHHLVAAFHLPSIVGHLFLVGSTILLSMIVATASCNFGALGGGDEHTANQDQELTVAQIMNSLLKNSDLN